MKGQFHNLVLLNADAYVSSRFPFHTQHTLICLQDKASDNNEAARAIARNAGSQSEIYRKNTHGMYNS